MGFARVRGRFDQFEASVAVDPSDLNTLTAEATVATASVDTGEAKRDDHLRSGDFFMSEEFPKLTFKSTGVKNVNGDKLTLIGELTIRDTTREVELDTTFLGKGIDPWGGTRVAFEASTTINRKDYGLNWNTLLETGGVLVSEDVKIELEIQAVEVASDKA